MKRCQKLKGGKNTTYYPKFKPVEYLILVSASATAVFAACLKSVELASLSLALVLVLAAVVLKDFYNL